MEDLRLSRAVHLFIESLINLDYDTQRAYQFDLNAFLIYWPLDPIIEDIDRRSITEYLNQLTTKNGDRVSVSTQNRHYATLKRFFVWLEQEEYIFESPFVNIPRRKAQKDLGELPTGSIIRAIPPNQIHQILTTLKKFSLREQVLFLLIYTTGLRVSEALALRRNDIQSDDTIIVRSTKGNKPRQTFVSKSLRPILRKYLQQLKSDSSEWLFPSPIKNKYYLSYGHARKIFKKLTKDLYNPDGSQVTIHQLRHTFATERAGYIDSILLMNLMGHSDIRTTLRYAKASNKATKQAFDMFDGRSTSYGF